MKKIFIIISVVLITVSMFAQSPEKISYQAVVRDASDNLVTNTSVGMQISILQGSVNGTVAYTERHFPITNTNGLISIEIGTGTIVSGDFSTIDWANDIYFIKTETDLNGGANYTITGTSQLLSVPYALHAKTAENISGTISETDPVYGGSVASGITGTDTTNWNNKLDVEIDGDVTNEIQMFSVSETGDTLYLSAGNWVIVPGISAVQPQPLTDYDGNVYQTVVIGNQEWMAENLKVTHYSDGTELLDGTGVGNISDDETTKYYFWYNEDPESGNTYGALYTWAAVMNGSISNNNNPSGVQGVCPDGWHVPSDEEWIELEMYLGMSENEAYSLEYYRGADEGGKLKESGTTHWNYQNIGATNESGFSALPGGERNPDGRWS